LGNTAVDSLLVVWPNQKYEVLKNVKLNATTKLSVETAKGIFEHKTFFNVTQKPIESVSPVFNFVHTEDEYNDINNQYLIPHMLSAQGPRIAVGDMNNDKKDDVFVCGTVGQSGQLFYQANNGSFQKANIPILDKNNFEQTNAKIFDANNDGFNDLLVVSGGNLPTLEKENIDLLFLNNGKGGFEERPFSIPQIKGNKSSIAVADIDNDKDLDVIIGVIDYYKVFTNDVNLHVFINDGKGIFSLAPNKMIKKEGLSLITAIECIDINNDDKQDIIVAGEWMPITIFMNKGERFEKLGLEGNGLWQSLLVEDINKDGHKDIIGGNWGNNSKIAADSSHPIHLYVHDLDKNGSLDHLLTYTKEGKEYPFLGKEELEKVMPSLKKKFLKFKDFAGKEINEVFEVKKSNVQKFTVDNTSSAYFLNDGKGNFTRKNLPSFCQITPMNTILKINDQGDYLAGGNYFGVRPVEGRYDAASLFTFNPLKGSHSIIDTKGETRDLKKIATSNGEVIVVGKNNSEVEFYKIMK
jgi:enediyne biosynthesis protein E4